jgi:hypothetical protein
MTPDLKTSLDDLAEAEYADAPVSTIDITKARADGRRRLRTARLAPVGGGVAVVAACALVVNGLGGTSAAKPASAPTGPAAAHAFTGTDPLTSVAEFGWLPDGFQTAEHTTGGDYGTGVVARTAPGPNPKAVPGILALAAWPTEPQPRPTQTRTAVTVKGAPRAYLVRTPGDGPSIPAELSLQWENASGSWFALDGPGAQEAELIRVAESVKAENSPVALPIHIEGLPTGLALGEAMLDDPAVVGQNGFTMGLSYHNGGTKPGTGHYFSVSVVPVGQGPAKSPAPETCKDSEGLHICVQDEPSQPGPDPLASVGGAQGLLDHITSLGTNRASWTTHVVN